MVIYLKIKERYAQAKNKPMNMEWHDLGFQKWKRVYLSNLRKKKVMQMIH